MASMSTPSKRMFFSSSARARRVSHRMQSRARRPSVPITRKAPIGRWWKPLGHHRSNTGFLRFQVLTR